MKKVIISIGISLFVVLVQTYSALGAERSSDQVARIEHEKIEAARK